MQERKESLAKKDHKDHQVQNMVTKAQLAQQDLQEIPMDPKDLKDQKDRLVLEDLLEYLKFLLLDLQVHRAEVYKPFYPTHQPIQIYMTFIWTLVPIEQMELKALDISMEPSGSISSKIIK